MNELVRILMRREELTRKEAEEWVAEARKRVRENGEDPEDILYEELGLEPDFVLDLLDF